MKNFLIYFMTFVIASVIIVIMTAPVFLLKEPIKRWSNWFEIAGMQGTILDGHAQQVRIKRPLINSLGINMPYLLDEVTIDSLKWQFLPKRLGSLELALDLQAQYASYTLMSQLGYGYDQSVRIRDFSTAIELSILLSLIKQAIPVDGMVFAKLTDMKFKGKQLLSLDAQLMTRKFSLYDKPLGILIADINFDQNEQITKVLLSSKDSDIEVDGQINIEPDRYQASIKLTPKINAAPELKDMLSLVGESIGNSRVLNTSGPLAF